MKILEITDYQHEWQIAKEESYDMIQYVKKNPLLWQFTKQNVKNFHLFGQNNLSFHGHTSYFRLRDSKHGLLDNKEQISRRFNISRTEVEKELIELAHIYFMPDSRAELRQCWLKSWCISSISTMSKYLDNAGNIIFPKSFELVIEYAKKYNKIEPVPDTWKKYEKTT